MPLSPLRAAGLLLAFAMLAGAQPTMTAVVTAALAILVVAVLAGTVTAAPAAVLLSSETLRRRARQTAFLPQLSPAAPGRPRPRAPSAT